ncbi:hypothetical protein I7I50_00460 [Histoplasma capsulatum G186AR]|uniref:Uncharacterized protein n=1 Tax=Ajellomyces capsulatus TaxID=5037 RepID=A0A8H8CUS7_AJECA|nr:hypothetical protein I7I52_07728 [Histoplasma capsulatum]QSS72573.1 hypothetical protein I7I50_00460 [Histoplasma capsulatum G186AR]
MPSNNKNTSNHNQLTQRSYVVRHFGVAHGYNTGSRHVEGNPTARPLATTEHRNERGTDQWVVKHTTHPSPHFIGSIVKYHKYTLMYSDLSQPLFITASPNPDLYNWHLGSALSI